MRPPDSPKMHRLPKILKRTVEKQNSTEQVKISQAAIRRGSVVGKIPVQINEKTYIFVRADRDPEKARQKYTHHLNTLDFSNLRNKPETAEI